MIELGNYNTLKIVRDTSPGLFLESETGAEILLPNKYVPKNFELGDEFLVFCYLDFDERPVATSLTPFMKRNEFGFLKVVEVNQIGAFLDWGLEKHLFVPFSEQRDKMKEGQWYVVFCYLDDISFRLVASNKIDKFLNNDVLAVRTGEKVELLITRLTDLGWESIVNNQHKGLIFSSEVFQHMAVGQKMQGYIKKIRPDNKLNISLQPQGQKVLEPTAQKISQLLKKQGGFLPLHDKSDPNEISKMLGMSKKTFKKGVGTLYKARRIEIKEDGIYLVGKIDN